MNGQLYKGILRDDSSDLKVFLQVFSKNEYLTIVRAVSDNADAKPLIIVDLGANIGLTALYLSAYLPVQKYIALEPSPENFALLCKNSEVNLFPGFVAEPFAIWNEEAVLQELKDFRDGMHWSRRFSELSAGSEPVKKIRGISFHQLMERHLLDEIDVLKIDIEGAEFVLFADNADTDWLQKVRFLAIEIHPDAGDVLVIKKKLREFGFTIFETGETTIGINRNFFK